MGHSKQWQSNMKSLNPSVLTFTIRFLTVMVNVYSNKFITHLSSAAHWHWSPHHCLGSTGYRSGRLSSPLAAPGHNWSPPGGAPGLEWPHTTRAQATASKNGKMDRNQEKSIKDWKRESPLLNECIFCMKAPAPLARLCWLCWEMPCVSLCLAGCGPCDTRYLSRQSDTISTFTRSQPQPQLVLIHVHVNVNQLGSAKEYSS